MRIVTLNINGIRAGARKGFFPWLMSNNIDVICLQEVRANEEQLTDGIFNPEGYHRFLFPAEKKGYSGVAIYTRLQPIHVQKGLGFSVFDEQGRYLAIDLNIDGRELTIGSLYLPSGSSGEAKQAAKYSCMDFYLHILKEQLLSSRSFIIGGDWNIAHKRIDIKNDKANEKNSGFLPEERAWMDNVFGELGYIDAFRKLNSNDGEYTWWSNRGRAWENNVGWRIDYQVVSPDLKDAIQNVSVYKEERFSDHAPLIVDYDL